MRIDFSGAAGNVTGSSHLLTINGHKVLLDCGLYQGKDAKERGNDVFPFVPSDVEYLILSHAHIDHSGRIPMLVKRGFEGKIITTPPSAELCGIMLLDSAFIQEQDASRDNKKRKRQGKALVEPLYTTEDAEEALKLFETLDYEITHEVFPGLKIRFTDSGHMLGSAFVELFIEEEGKEPYVLVFSGDVGNHNIPLFKEPKDLDRADYLIMESTYGNRVHMAAANENDKLIDIINTTIKRGGNVVIPSFAIGRTQEIIYIINQYAETGRLDPNVKIYVDSPLASKATEIFKRNTSYMDEETQSFIKKGDNVFEFPNLFFTDSVEDSMILNATKSGLVIISASGMADAGRVRHHLKHNLWRPECSVCFVGYQAEGTLGQIIQSGKETVTIFGEPIRVNAEIHNFTGLSGHADSVGLLRWANAFKIKPKKIYLVHGDEDAREALKLKLNDAGFIVEKPMNGTVVKIEDINDSVEFKEAPKTVSEDMTGRDKVVSLEGEPSVTEKTDFKETIKNKLDTNELEKLSKEDIIKMLKDALEKDN